MKADKLATKLAIKYGLGIHDPNGSVENGYQNINPDANYMHAIKEAMYEFVARQLVELLSEGFSTMVAMRAWAANRAAELRKESNGH